MAGFSDFLLFQTFEEKGSNRAILNPELAGIDPFFFQD